MKKRVLAMLMMVCVMGMQVAVASAAEPVKSISCTVDTGGDKICITGRISNASSHNEVALLVGEDVYHALYLDQTTSDNDGNFTFTFPMPPDIPSGSYPYYVGSDSGATLFQSTFLYEGKKEYQKFVDADFNIAIHNYVPTVSGTVSCPASAKAVFRVTNVTDNTTVMDDKVTASDGKAAISFSLSSLLNPKTYVLEISFVDGAVTLGGMHITLQTSGWKVAVDGNITVLNGAKMQAQLKSLNSSLIDKAVEITAKKEIHTSIPNVIASTQYRLLMQGYAYQIAPPTSEAGAAQYTITGNANGEAIIVATASNMQDLSGKTFVLQYQPTQIRPVDVFGFCIGNTVGTGRMGDVTILRCEEGEIEFSVAHEVPAGQSWSGALNIFKFAFQDGYSGASKLQLNELKR